MRNTRLLTRQEERAAAALLVAGIVWVARSHLVLDFGQEEVQMRFRDLLRRDSEAECLVELTTMVMEADQWVGLRRMWSRIWGSRHHPLWAVRSL